MSPEYELIGFVFVREPWELLAAGGRLAILFAGGSAAAGWIAKGAGAVLDGAAPAFCEELRPRAAAAVTRAKESAAAGLLILVLALVVRILAAVVSVVSAVVGVFA